MALLVLAECIFLDLVRDEYSFGRADECDYCFERNGGRDNAHFRTFSNTHFRIYKVTLIWVSFFQGGHLLLDPGSGLNPLGMMVKH